MYNYRKNSSTQLHRIISWWLVVFAILSILTGYMVAREWVFNLVFWERIHLILQWSFISLSLFHLIYTFGWVRIKTSKLLKNPKIHWVRILQQITKWLMIVFSIMVIFTGLTYYDWFDIPVFEGIFPFTKHLKWDLYLSLTITCSILLKFNRQAAGFR